MNGVPPQFHACFEVFLGWKSCLCHGPKLILGFISSRSRSLKSWQGHTARRFGARRWCGDGILPFFVELFSIVFWVRLVFLPQVRAFPTTEMVFLPQTRAFSFEEHQAVNGSKQRFRV